MKLGSVENGLGLGLSMDKGKGGGKVKRRSGPKSRPESVDFSNGGPWPVWRKKTNKAGHNVGSQPRASNELGMELGLPPLGTRQ